MHPNIVGEIGESACLGRRVYLTYFVLTQRKQDTEQHIPLMNNTSNLLHAFVQRLL